MKLNIQKIVDDFGGASAVADIVGTPRTAPYGWIRRHYISSRVFEALKNHNPQMKLDSYFENEKNRRGAGTS